MRKFFCGYFTIANEVADDVRNFIPSLITFIICSMMTIVSFVLILWATVLLCVSLSPSCHAGVLKLQEVNLVYRNFVPGGRNSLLYPEQPHEALGLGMNIDILSWFYWNPNVYAMTTESQYRSIGLEFNLGIHLTSWLDLSYRHHSQHLLERSHDFMNKFPVEDALELKIYLYRSKERSDYMLGF